MNNKLEVTNLLLMGILCNALFAEPINTAIGFIYLAMVVLIQLIDAFSNKEKNGE